MRELPATWTPADPPAVGRWEAWCDWWACRSFVSTDTFVLSGVCALLCVLGVAIGERLG